ncbi:MAG: hypothetical protein KY442_11480, partial [Proteobacteria bacterium]|nr:hypothetical protein [Pseudomonadota bacterium]
AGHDAEVVHAPAEGEVAVTLALVQRAQAGDTDAFGELYDRYVDMVYRYVYYRVGSAQVAEDLTSETFLRALRRLSSFTWQGRDVGELAAGKHADLIAVAGDPLADEDLHLALYLGYELHYRGLPGVDERWEWNPGLLGLRAVLEGHFEEGLVEAVPRPAPVPAEATDEALREIAKQADDGVLLSWSFTIPLSKVMPDWRDKSRVGPRVQSEPVYCLARADWQEARLAEAALSAHQRQVRERSYVSAAAALFRVH